MQAHIVKRSIEDSSPFLSLPPPPPTRIWPSAIAAAASGWIVAGAAMAYIVCLIRLAAQIRVSGVYDFTAYIREKKAFTVRAFYTLEGVPSNKELWFVF